MTSHRLAPNRQWFADFTYLRCWEGLVFFSFVIDAYSRRIVGWQFASHMRTDLVLDALRMALHQRQPGADVGSSTTADRQSRLDSTGPRNTVDRGGVDGQASWVDDGVDGQGADEVAGEAVAASGRGAVVLA